LVRRRSRFAAERFALAKSHHRCATGGSFAHVSVSVLGAIVSGMAEQLGRFGLWPMKYVKFGCVGVLASVAVGLVLLVGIYFYENSDSFGASSLRSKLVAELERSGSVRISDLVGFK
jgi:hypothetical protein